LLIALIWIIEFHNYGGPSATADSTGPVTVASAAMPTEGDSLSRMIWLSMLLFGVVVVASRFREALKLLRNTNPYMLLFVGLAICSIAWSIEPGITIVRLARVLTVLLASVAFGLVYKSPKNFQAIFRPAFTAILIGSIILVMVNPKLAIEQLSNTELVGAWRGLASQKNALGSLASLSLVLWLHAFLSKESPMWRALPGIAISALCLVKSRSSTSIMAAVFACGLMLMLLRSPPALKRYMPYIVTLFVGTLLVYSLAVLDLLPGSGILLSPITSLTGKDLTFSGRTAIWQVINENIALHRWLGGGYGAYWSGLPQSPSMVMLVRVYFYPTESHNGYIDVVNDLGYAGGACLVGYVIYYVRQGLQIFRFARAQGALFLTLLLQQMIGNLSEAHWFNCLTNEFIIMTIATLVMAEILTSRKQAVEAAGRQQMIHSGRPALLRPQRRR